MTKKWDHVILGRCPADETPVEVGSDNWEDINGYECDAFADQIERLVESQDYEWLDGSKLTITAVDIHGTLHVALKYEQSDKFSENVAQSLKMEVDKHCRKWDDEAKQEFGMS